MLFIFPKNYNLSSKFLGIIDYLSLFFNLMWQIFIFCLSNLLFNNITIKISLFIAFCLPLLILSITGMSNESIFFMLYYLVKFIFSNKIYLFNKF